MLSTVFRITSSIARLSLTKQFSAGRSALAPFRFGAIFIHSINQRKLLQLCTDRVAGGTSRFHKFVVGFANRKMSQAKISSFFTKKKDSTGSPAKETVRQTKKGPEEDEAKVEDSSASSDCDSPVKTVKSKRRTRILDASR